MFIDAYCCQGGLPSQVVEDGPMINNASLLFAKKKYISSSFLIITLTVTHCIDKSTLYIEFDWLIDWLALTQDRPICHILPWEELALTGG